MEKKMLILSPELARLSHIYLLLQYQKELFMKPGRWRHSSFFPVIHLHKFALICFSLSRVYDLRTWGERKVLVQDDFIVVSHHFFSICEKMSWNKIHVWNQVEIFFFFQEKKLFFVKKNICMILKKKLVFKHEKKRISPDSIRLFHVWKQVNCLGFLGEIFFYLVSLETLRTFLKCIFLVIYFQSLI